MNASLLHSRHEGLNLRNDSVISERNDAKLRYLRAMSFQTNNCRNDLCPLLSDVTSTECPSSLEQESSAYHSFRNRNRSCQSQTPQLGRLESSISISSLSAARPHMEELMRRRLKYFFMNPCQKYQAKRRKPFKLAIQIIKIALVTIQLNVFGASNQMLMDFKLQNEAVFTSVFLSHNYSFYVKSEVYSQVFQIRNEYALWKNNSIGIYDYPSNNIGDNFHFEDDMSRIPPPPVHMCVTSFSQSDVDSSSKEYDFDLAHQNRTCMELKVWREDEKPNQESIPLENGSDYRIDFIRLVNIKFCFKFITMQVKTPAGFTPPTCFNVTVGITLDNSEHTGKMTATLLSEYHMTQCDDTVKQPFNSMKIFLNIFDCVIILTCMLSLILCTRSLYRAQVLRRGFEKFFQAHYNKQLGFSDRLEFFNMWYLLIIISDALTILGSVAKIVLQNKDTGIVDYNICSVFLGVGCLCVWIGVLRYAGFFQKYNILVLTLKKSMPHVCRFMVCASLLYLGFMFCGWVVLGPHHHKFRNLVVTSEALFSLINGDDMYMTYEEMSKRSTAMVVFAQIYLYTFISLFIYVVLSLFIAVIMDTYETIKDWQDRAEPIKSELEKFIAPCTADASVENYGFDGLNSPTRCCCCFGGNDEDFETDDEILDE